MSQPSVLEAMGHLRPGQQVSHFELVRLLGHGAMGVVFEARDVVLDRPVAIKFIYMAGPHMASPAVMQAVTNRFMREARTMARVRHNGLVAIYEADFSSHEPFIVMEYLDGQDLEERMHASPRLTPLEVLDIARQAAAALHAAWEAHQLIHRDLKPGNMKLLPDGSLKIIDLGLAKALADDSTQNNLTVTGMVMGTPYYMSPEQHIGTKSIDHSTDTYALGTILFQLLSGRLPATGKNNYDLYTNKLKGPGDDLARTSGLPPALIDLVVGMLDPDQDTRISDYPTIIAGLDAAIHELRGGSVPTPPATAGAAPDIRAAATPEDLVRVLTPGSRWGDYTLGPLIGMGGMGAVYRATAPDGSAAAIKFLAMGDDAATRLPAVRAVVRGVEALRHDAIVPVRTIAEAHGLVYEVMDLFLGPGDMPVNLVAYCRDYGQDGLADEAEFIPIMSHMLSALAHAHDHGLAHGNLKPENILLSIVEQGGDSWQAELKITDFGTNQIIGEEQVLLSATRSLSAARQGSELTADIAAMLETYDYMAPEQRRGQPATPRSDVYSMGLIMLRLLTGKRELERRTLPSQMRPGINPGWDDIILTALRERPDDRQPSAHAVQQSLDALH